MRDLYSDFFHAIHSVAHNIVCASCSSVEHDPASFQTVSVMDPSLAVLAIPCDIFVPYDFSSGVTALDSRAIMIDKMGLSTDSDLFLCHLCYKAIKNGGRPHESLANFRWVGEQPAELQSLTWLEELLIARAHLVGRIVRLEERKTSSYFALKGHTILLPQDTTRLLNLLPLSHVLLPDVVRVVWTGKSMPEKSRLRSYFTVRTRKIRDALEWLCRHHEDYRQVIIDEERLSAWGSTFVATELLESMSHVTDSAAEDASRSGFATDDLDDGTFEGDIPLTVSSVLDVNDVTRSSEVALLQQLARTRNRNYTDEIVINVVTGKTVLSDYGDPTYFTSAFPTLFHYGTGKHLDARRTNELQLSAWIRLLLKHSSRFESLISTVF